MKIKTNLVVILSFSCLFGCGKDRTPEKPSETNLPEPIQLTQAEDDALVEAGILPPSDWVESPEEEKVFPSKFSDKAVAEIMSILDKQTALFNDYRIKEIALWKTLDEEVAKQEQATFDNDQLIATLTRDSLHYRLTHPPVIIRMDKRYGGLIGMDAFEVTDGEDAAIDYKNRNDDYLRDLKSLTSTRELMKKKLSLQREHAELFEKLGDIWNEAIPLLDQQLSDAIINNAQQ